MEHSTRILSPERQGSRLGADRQPAGNGTDAGFRRGDPAVRLSLQTLNAAGLRRARFRAMGSPCEVLVDSLHEQPAQAATSAVVACARQIEQKFSRYRPDN